MARKGSEILQFRVSPELRGAILAFQEQHELESESAAARMLLTIALGIEEGATPKDAAMKAAINEVVWSTHRAAQEVVRAELQGLGPKITKALRAA